MLLSLNSKTSLVKETHCSSEYGSCILGWWSSSLSICLLFNLLHLVQLSSYRAADSLFPVIQCFFTVGYFCFFLIFLILIFFTKKWKKTFLNWCNTKTVYQSLFRLWSRSFVGKNMILATAGVTLCAFRNNPNMIHHFGEDKRHLCALSSWHLL